MTTAFKLWSFETNLINLTKTKKDKNMKTKYTVIEHNRNRNKITELGEFDNLNDAKAHIEELFFIELNSSDVPEFYDDYFEVELEDGKIISFEEFSKLEDVENYEYIFTGDDYWEHDQRCYSIVEEQIEEITDIFNDLELKRAIELYDSVGMNADYMLEDYNNDFLSINEGSDGQKYIWYLDDNYDIAINIESGEIVDAEQTEKLFA